MNEEKLYGFIGWKEFLTNRKELLDEYDKAKQKNSNRPIRTSHGIAGESAFRKLLKNHLPERYGITSGYIIPDIISSEYLLYHFDVIIYDKLNSPVLWSEEDFDTSDLGKKRAIPAKYVLSVIEIKATFNEKNVKDSMTKLNQLESLQPYLHPYFSCNAVFFEINNSEINNVNILKNFLFDNKVRFWGGMILRSDVNPNMTGLIRFGKMEDSTNNQNFHTDSTTLVRDVDETKLILKKNGEVQFSNGGVEFYKDKIGNHHFAKKFFSSMNKGNLSVLLDWSYSSFSEYIIKSLHLVENINEQNETKYFFGKVYNYLEQEE